MTGAEGRARTIDVDGTFAGEGEDMIAALIAASANPATRGGAGRGDGDDARVREGRRRGQGEAIVRARVGAV